MKTGGKDNFLIKDVGTRLLLGWFKVVTDDEIFRSTNNFRNMMRWSLLLRKINVLSITGEIKMALETGNECLLIAEKTAIKKLISDTNLCLAEIYADLGDFFAVKDKATKALIFYEQINDIEGEAWSLNQLGRAFVYEGRLDEAIEKHRSAEVLFKKCNNLEGQAYTHNNLANLYWRNGSTAEAQQSYEAALELFKRLGLQQQISLALNNLGTVFQRFGDHSASNRYFADSLRIRKEIGDKMGIGTVLNNMGMNALFLGNYESAIDHLQQALRTRRETGQIKEMGIIYSNIGNAYAKLGEYDKANGFYLEALDIKKRMHDDYSLAVTYLSMAIAALDTRKNDEAQECLNKVSAINKKLNNDDLHARMNEVAVTLRLETDMPIDEQVKKQIEIDIESAMRNKMQVRLATFLMLKGRIRLVENDYGEANRLFTQSLDIFINSSDRYNRGKVLYFMGIAHCLAGNSPKAIGVLRESLDIFGTIKARLWLNRVGSFLKEKENRP